MKATLLQLEELEGGMEERLNAPAAPCLSCADWFLPAASARHRLDHAVATSSSSPVLSKLAGAMKGSSSVGARGRGLFGDKTRRPSPKRGLSDSGSDGPQQDHGEGSGAVAGVSPHSTPDSARRPGARRDSLGSLGSDGSGSLFKVRE